jgi:hypothetical protein
VHGAVQYLLLRAEARGSRVRADPRERVETLVREAGEREVEIR